MGDIADIVGGGTPSTGNQSYWDGDIDWYAPAEIADQIYANSSQKKITGLGYENSSAKMLPPGTVLFTSRAGIGKTAILTRKGCTNQGFQSIVPHRGELDSYFIFSRTEELKRYGELVGAGSTFVEVSGKQMAVMELMMPPTMREQQTIGGFFQQLDHLITLHQRKCVFLFGFFQAFISMIFTASTFSWEQRKFSDITFPAGEKNKDNLPLESYSITNEHGFVPQDEKFENGGTMREADKRMYYIVSPNSFAYNPARINVGSIGYQNIGKNVIVSSLYEVFKTSEDVDDRLLWHWFKSSDFQKLIMQLQEGGVRLYFYYDKLCMGEVSLPSLDEQRKIGKLFDTLDNLITLHQRECISFTARAGRLILTANKKRNTSSWEQRKVQGVADRFDNLRIPVAANLRVHGTTPYYGANGIQDYVEGFTHDGEFVLVAEDGANDLKNYPVKCVNGRIWVNNHAHVLQGKAGIADNSFLAFAISQSDIESLLVGGGRAKLNAETLMSIEFRLPCLQEQYRIGEYLTQLNHLITLHQRKFEKLTNVKKSMLEKMFPQNGSSYPEIRFKGFTDPWEQRKLGDVVQITMGQSPDGSTYSDEPSDYILVQGNADLQNGWVCPRIWTTQITKKADAGDLIMSVRAPAGAMGKTAYNAVIGRGVAAIKGNEFIYQLLVKMDADGFWKTLSCGSTFESLNSDNIKNAEVKIPTTAEQIKIGGYFQQLDNLITLHQRELEKLQNIKKSMLEKMFV